MLAPAADGRDMTPGRVATPLATESTPEAATSFSPPSVRTRTMCRS